MATVQFGNTSADMRLAFDYYGISALREFDNFLAAFVAVGDPVVTQTPTQLIIVETNAAGQTVVATATGNVATMQFTELTVEALGIRETVKGDISLFEVGGEIQVAGVATQATASYVTDGAIIASVADANFPITDDLNFPADATVLAGNDYISSGSGNDFLLGYAGNDTIFGGAGNDGLSGGLGIDTLFGQGGADRYEDTAAGLNADLLADFEQADAIVVQGASFGWAQLSYNGGTGALSLDTDTDGSADTTISLPAGLVGGFSVNLVSGGTQIDFDAWSFKIWGGAASDVPVVGNFDGVGGDEYGVYRVATAEWFLYGQPPYVWGGGPYDIPVVGDYNGDGQDEFGVYRQNTAEWWLVGQPLYVWGGGAQDIPVVGDFNGDGADDFGVYRQNTAEWFIVGQPKYVWGGGPNDVPVVGDYNGDGIDDFGVYRKDTAEWFIVGQPRYVWGGGPNDTPVVGDFNGDSRDDFGVYRSDTGEWLIANQLTRFIGGGTNDPVPADYDGDGLTDHAVFNDGIWAIDPSSDVLI